MSKHGEALGKLLARIAELDPDSGCFLFGSVAAGTEKPDSDIDLQVIVKTGTQIDGVALESDEGYIKIDELDGVLLDLVFWPVSAIEQRVAHDEAAILYLLTRGKIIRDPRGIAKYYQVVLERHFERNDAVRTAWENQMALYGKYKSDPTFPLEFPKWNKFALGLDDRLRRRT